MILVGENQKFGRNLPVLQRGRGIGDGGLVSCGRHGLVRGRERGVDDSLVAHGLGDEDNRLSPTEITSLGTDNAYIAAQSDGGMALKSDGRLFNWGSNFYNNLGDGTTTDRLSPVELAAVGSDNAHVVGGGYHALLLKADGSVLTKLNLKYNSLGNAAEQSLRDTVARRDGFELLL